ncbi:GrdX family protein [Alloiococcus sp. CFN-8]|uniref:GrdX family protein n=1 Tax=Alloiococcus sp. CFN-8 TaxID=3416081 RepID=UPI003CEF0E69
MLIITNNSMVKEYYENSYETLFIEGQYREVLVQARDRIHNGHKLLTHPLSGSIKPGETPYKSLVISKEAGRSLDINSLELIESAIASHDKFMTKCRYRDSSVYTEKVLEDFKEVDFTLLQSALN